MRLGRSARNDAGDLADALGAVPAIEWNNLYLTPHNADVTFPQSFTGCDPWLSGDGKMRHGLGCVLSGTRRQHSCRKPLRTRRQHSCRKPSLRSTDDRSGSCADPDVSCGNYRTCGKGTSDACLMPLSTSVSTSCVAAERLWVLRSGNEAVLVLQGQRCRCSRLTRASRRTSEFLIKSSERDRHQGPRGDDQGHFDGRRLLSAADDATLFRRVAAPLRWAQSVLFSYRWHIPDPGRSQHTHQTSARNRGVDPARYSTHPMGGR